MNEFLASLDQWAFQVLMLLYHTMGVQDLPSGASPHWKVVERWAEQPDGHYRLVLESETIQEECRSGRARYVIFPQTYMAKQEIYADNIRVYTNEMDKEWHLRSIIDRPVISCDLLVLSRKIIFSVDSSMEYFSSINYYPYIASFYPKGQYFFYYNYLVSGALSICVTVIVSLILIVLGEKNLNLFGIGLAIFIIMTAHAPGYLVQIHLDSSHYLIMAGTFILSFFYTRNKFPIFQKRKHIFFLLIFIILFFICFYGRKNSTQLILLSGAVLTSFSGIIYAIFSSKHTKIDKYNMIFVFGVAIFDVYRSQAYREGFLNLSFLILAILAVELILIIKKIYFSNVKIKNIQNKLLHQRKSFDIVTNVNEKLKEALHDLKSPITSLNFMIGRRDLNTDQLRLVSERLNNITNKIANDESVFLANWADLDTFNASVLEVVNEMSVLFKEINVNLQENKSLQIYFNIDDFKNIISELLNNSFKAGSKKVAKSIIKITSSITDSKMTIFLCDDAGGVEPSLINKLGQKGFSTNGSGFGLWMIKQRLDSVGGSVKFKNHNKGLGVYISFIVRASSS